MSICKTPPVVEAPRSAHAKSLRKRTATAAGTFLVASAFALAGAPAATAESASMNQSVPAASDRPVLLCNGDYPGFCIP